MNKILLSILTLLMVSFSYAQFPKIKFGKKNKAPKYNKEYVQKMRDSDSLTIINISKDIAELSDFKFDKVEKEGNDYAVTLLPKDTESKDDIIIQVSVFFKNRNLDLGKEGHKRFKIRKIYGKYLHLNKFWKTYFNPNADDKAITKSRKDFVKLEQGKASFTDYDRVRYPLLWSINIPY